MKEYLYRQITHLTNEVADKSKWSLLATPVVLVIERYIFNDWNFLKFLAVLILLDTALGLGYAIYRWQVSASKFMGIIIKAVIYGPVLILGHVFENFEVSGQPMEGGFYFKVLFYTGLMIVEGISILRNLGKINKKLVPAFILKRFEGFNETGDFQELTGKKSNQDYPNNPTDAIN
jgi:hypothetical protein